MPQIKRPPIVVVMGHVDHGKTTLLDYIRKTSVAAREAGGITQSIGAYEITHNGERITFIDTPGHEAFSKMRARGAQVADLAILVVAADDGVKPQTKDALSHILQAKIPYIVAINKIDKPNANIEKTKGDLAQAGVYLEGLGGDVSYQTISAKTGEGVNDLLDLILLAAQMEDFTYDPQASASGIILTCQVDPRKGLIVTGVLKDGTLHTGDLITTSSAAGKAKKLENFLGASPQELFPSSPFLILGFDSLPAIGEEFVTGDARCASPMASSAGTAFQAPDSSSEDYLRVLLKADEAGSLEALRDLVHRISKEVAPICIVSDTVGNIHESDVKLAESSKAVIVSFRTKTDRAADTLIRSRSIHQLSSLIIYELEKLIRDHAQKSIMPVHRALQILAVFGPLKNGKQVIGGKVITGPIKNQEHFEIWDNEQQVGKGKILNMRSRKDDISSAPEGSEAGLSVHTDIEIRPEMKLLFRS